MAMADSNCAIDIGELAMERPCNPMSALVVAGYFAPAVKLRVAAVSNIR